MSHINSSAGRHGELKLAFARRNGRTVLAESFSRVPLQVMKPRYDESGCACVYLLSPTGGVVQGDDYQIEVALAPNSHALMTTQAATKVYAMPIQGAAQSMQGQIGKDAIFEYLPDSTILFRDANFSQRVSFSLERGAMVVMQEIVMPGRLARGENLAFTHYQSHLEVSDLDGMLLFDSCCLRPKHQPYLTAHGVLEGYACWGSWFLVGDFEMPQWEALCESCRTIAQSRGQINRRVDTTESERYRYADAGAKSRRNSVRFSNSLELDKAGTLRTRNC